MINPIRTSCNHIFDQANLALNYAQRTSCPLCRRIITPAIFDHTLYRRIQNEFVRVNPQNGRYFEELIREQPVTPYNIISMIPNQHALQFPPPVIVGVEPLPLPVIRGVELSPYQLRLRDRLLFRENPSLYRRIQNSFSRITFRAITRRISSIFSNLSLIFFFNRCSQNFDLRALNITHRFIRNGQLRLAKLFANTIRNPNLKNYSYFNIANRYLNHLDFENCKSVLEKINYNELRDLIHRRLTIEYIKSFKILDAFSSLNSHSSLYQAFLTLISLALLGVSVLARGSVHIVENALSS